MTTGRRRRVIAFATAGAVLVAASAYALLSFTGRSDGNAPSFRAQACGLPAPWLARIVRGYFEDRSGQVSLLPKQPAYMATGGGGWSHSGPWPYLQDIPLAFFGPGVVPATGEVDRPATLADVAPTLATLLRGVIKTRDGKPLPEVARLDARRVQRPAPRLIVVIVWDGAGWNTLDQWPDAWPNLARMMRAGVSYSNATVGSSPSVTPAVHTSLGTGSLPWVHGITGVPVRDEKGVVVDSFEKGESSRFIQVPALAELWDEQNENKALVGMVGYEPWHLGMIGQGAERPGGDRDHAAWLNVETNDWTSNPDHYALPDGLVATKGLERDLARTDAADGKVDGSWRDNPILGSPDRMEEAPGFIAYQERALENIIADEGYGQDEVTDLLFTNFKQIDRNGHYYNMASPEVRDSVVATDRALGRLLDFLSREVGLGAWTVVVTADHGQQPEAEDVGGYGIDPKEVLRDINAEFGPVGRAVWPTEVFLLDDEMSRRGVTPADVARFLGDYRLRDNTARPDIAVSGAGRFRPGDRLFEMAIPAAMLRHVSCR